MGGSSHQSTSFFIIEELQKEVVSYFHSRMHTTKKYDTKSETIYQTKQKIEETIQSLQQSSHWLSEESKHKLSHTHPHDVSCLFQTYNELEDKTSMDQTILSSLETIQTSLIHMKQEIEENKRRDILKRSEVIQVRE